VVDGKVEQVPVIIGQRRKADVELVSGVKADDVVIIAGQMKLQPGAPVTPLFPEMLQVDNQ
jgi:membrane fusion protein (multidrug efflux system)